MNMVLLLGNLKFSMHSFCRASRTDAINVIGQWLRRLDVYQELVFFCQDVELLLGSAFQPGTTFPGTSTTRGSHEADTPQQK